MTQIQGYLTAKEAGERLGISDSRIRQLIIEGRLESIKVGQMRLIKETAIELIRERKNGRPKKIVNLQTESLRKR